MMMMKLLDYLYMYNNRLNIIIYDILIYYLNLILAGIARMAKHELVDVTYIKHWPSAVCCSRLCVSKANERDGVREGDRENTIIHRPSER